jgi:hypothetical protein
MFAKESGKESLMFFMLLGWRARISRRIGLSVIFATKPLAPCGTQGTESK